MSFYHSNGYPDDPFQAPPPWWIIVPVLSLVVGVLWVIMENQ